MCLIVDEKKTVGYRERKRKSPWILCYKRVKCEVLLTPKGLVRAVRAPLRDTKYLNIGTGKIVMCNPRSTSKLILQNTWDARAYVEEGIHAYTKPPEQQFLSNNTLKCYGHIDDLIAVGMHGDIAFTKLRVCDADTQRMRDFLAGVEE